MLVLIKGYPIILVSFYDICSIYYGLVSILKVVGKFKRLNTDVKWGFYPLSKIKHLINILIERIREINQVGLINY